MPIFSCVIKSNNTPLKLRDTDALCYNRFVGALVMRFGAFCSGGVL